MPDKPQTACDVMKQARLEALPAYPQRKNLDEQTYRQQLIDYYQQMRKQQYLYTVKNEAMKLYNGIGGYGYSANNIMWRKEVPDNVADTAISRTTIVQSRVNSEYHPTTASSCAITVCALNDQICNKMGFAPLIDGGKANTNGAPGLCSSPNAKQIVKDMCNSDDPQIKARGERIKNINNSSWSKRPSKDPEKSKWERPSARKSMKELIENGTLQPGDGFSVEADNGSGSHAMTLTDVIRNEKGVITGYTLHANNTSKYVYYDINGKYGKESYVTTILPANYHAMSQIKKETDGLQNMTTEELERSCQQLQISTQERIEDLYNTEEQNRTLKIPTYTEKINKTLYVNSEGYNKELAYVQSQRVVTSQEQSMQSENDLTSDFLNKYQHHNSQTPEKDLTNEFKQKYQQSADGNTNKDGAARTENRDNKRQAEQQVNNQNISSNSSNNTNHQRSYARNPYLMNRGSERV